ncbi:MAG: class II fructose-bisphosphate aldolase [Patescibacteria group bacterium]
MKTLRHYIQEAHHAKRAIGHFNVSNMEGVSAIVKAREVISKEVGFEVPVIIGVSEGERDFFGVKQIAAVVKSIRATGAPVFLNADHTYSFDRVKEVIDAGFDMVIFDGTEFSFAENVAVAKKCVAYAKSVKSFFGERVLVECELGYIGKSSKVLEAVPDGASISEDSLVKPEEARQFVKETGIDLLAPAVGNIHGMFAKGKDPALNIDRVKAVSEATCLPLVLHGASGNTDADIQNAIKAGVAIVHVSTELRVAFRHALDTSLVANPKEVAGYKYLAPAREAIQKVVEEKLRVFNQL